ncbi:MAG: CoA transferase [Immundisolibacterales bacterium]|nr:CoA transferase [Immundisolibacterales bacterium]
MSQAFEGVRIVDFTQVVAGPVATYQLGMLGAEVVKVEQVEGGDIARAMLDFTDFGRGEMAPAFVGVNHNKRSIAVDLKRAEGRAAVERIVRRADVVVENFKPGVIGRLGFDYETVRAWRPSIVYCSISGYGQAGPRRSMAAFDGAIQAASGMMTANGHEETGPTRTVSPIIDVTTGMMAAFAIASALHRREKTGEGQFLDVAMLDSAVCLLNPVYNNHLATGEEPELLGNQSLTKMPTANVFATADGYVQVTALTSAQVDRLLGVLGCPELREDPRFVTVADLIANRAAMSAELCARLCREPTSVWLERFEAARVPAARITGFAEVMADPQLETRRLTATLPAPPVLGRPALTSVTTGYVADTDGAEVRTFAPRLGEHTRDILAEHGFAESEIDALHAAEVVRSPADPESWPAVPASAGTSPSAAAAAD